MTDIDIDFIDRGRVLGIVKHVPASIDGIKKHNTGVYVQPIPVNPMTGYATIDYKTAEDRGYFKLDFLNVSAYQGVHSEDHLVQLLNTEPLWKLLHEKEICDQLFHVNGYHSLLKELNPTTIEELAMVLAMIRPGKKHLIPTCKDQGFQSIKDDIWVKVEDSYFFKQAHAISYAAVIVVQLNLICEKISVGYS